MILQPGVIALLLASLGTTGLLLYAAGIGIQILRGWDVTSSSEQQLMLERKTALVSSIIAILLGFQIATLALFIYTADALHPLFTGSMCAVGTLNVNPFGYPTLLAKLACTVISGIWLILNRADNRSSSSPLTRTRFLWLLVLAPMATVESVSLVTFFMKLKPNVITSCCGSLFDGGKATLSSVLAGLTPLPTALVFYITAIATLISSLYTWRTGRGSRILAVGSVTTFVTGIAALIAFFCLYYYEIPTHHCPFCLLQPEYGRIGFLLYGLLIAGVITGCGGGALERHKTKPGLTRVIPHLQRRLAICAAISFTIYLILVTYQAAVSSFKSG
ncbi:MAG: hypothetical protein ACOYL3_00445 [Desulfuromonadaceae bacterium]